MRSHAAIVLPIALLAAGAAAKNVTECADGLYMIVARGTTEAAGTGVTGEIADDIADRISGSKILGLNYPATFSDPDYNVSEADGVKAMREAIDTYHESCPDGKMAVLGYSQGAQVTSDVFCGGSGGDGFANETELPPLSMQLVHDSVVAIVLFGDPTHVANVSYDRGTSINDGIFSRSNISVCLEYSDFLRSYCDTGDIYCDSGTNTTVHGLYVERYGTNATNFVVDKYEEAIGNSTSASGTATASTATPTGTATGTATGSAAASATASGTGTATSASASASSTTTKGAASGFVPSVIAAAFPLVMAMIALM